MNKGRKIDFIIVLVIAILLNSFMIYFTLIYGINSNNTYNFIFFGSYYLSITTPVSIFSSIFFRNISIPINNKLEPNDLIGLFILNFVITGFFQWGMANFNI